MFQQIKSYYSLHLSLWQILITGTNNSNIIFILLLNGNDNIKIQSYYFLIFIVLNELFLHCFLPPFLSFPPSNQFVQATLYSISLGSG